MAEIIQINAFIAPHINLEYDHIRDNTMAEFKVNIDSGVYTAQVERRCCFSNNLNLSFVLVEIMYRGKSFQRTIDLYLTLF